MSRGRNTEVSMSAPMIWTTFRVQWDGLTSLCGSVPADPEITRAWLEARAPSVRAPGARTINEINEEVFATLAEGEPNEGSLLVFQRVAGTVVMRAATVRAHLKDCARVISAQYVARIKGERAFSTRVINGVYLDPRVYWLPVLRPDGSAVTAADGERDKAIHVRTPQGAPMNAIKRFEYVEPWRLDFTLQVLGKSVGRDDLEILMQYGGVHGYAGERGDGEGRYAATISEEEERNGC